MICLKEVPTDISRTLQRAMGDELIDQLFGPISVFLRVSNLPGITKDGIHV